MTHTTIECISCDLIEVVSATGIWRRVFACINFIVELNQTLPCVNISGRERHNHLTTSTIALGSNY